MENLAFCIKNSLLPTSSFGGGGFGYISSSSSFGGGWEEAAILYQARGYEFPVIIPPLSDGDVYGYTVFKTNSADNTNSASNSFSSLYPNPTKDQLFLDYALDNEQQATISLFDLNGHIVKQDKLTGNGKLQWSVETLPSGFYYYQIQKNNDNIITDKVIIIK